MVQVDFVIVKINAKIEIELTGREGEESKKCRTDDKQHKVVISATRQEKHPAHHRQIIRCFQHGTIGLGVIEQETGQKRSEKARHNEGRPGGPDFTVGVISRKLVEQRRKSVETAEDDGERKEQLDVFDVLEEFGDFGEHAGVLLVHLHGFCGSRRRRRRLVLEEKERKQQRHRGDTELHNHQCADTVLHILSVIGSHKHRGNETADGTTEGVCKGAQGSGDITLADGEPRGGDFCGHVEVERLGKTDQRCANQHQSVRTRCADVISGQRSNQTNKAAD